MFVVVVFTTAPLQTFDGLFPDSLDVAAAGGPGRDQRVTDNQLVAGELRERPVRRLQVGAGLQHLGGWPPAWAGSAGRRRGTELAPFELVRERTDLPFRSRRRGLPKVTVEMLPLELVRSRSRSSSSASWHVLDLLDL